MDADCPDIDAGRALFELAPRLTRLENAALRDVSPPLTLGQFRLLERVDHGLTTVTALGQAATITLPAVSESVDGLVEKGLLLRRANQQDRRESHLSLTEEGQRVLKNATALLTRLAFDVLGDVPPERLEELFRDVRMIAAQVDVILRQLRGSRAAVGQ